jgi:ABC-type transport system substrate-binding protein
MKNYFFGIFILLALLGISFYLMTQKSEKERVLRVAYPGEWSDLVPTLQRTAYADALLHNQFEPLVVLGGNGTVQPLAAKSWTMSDDKRVFTFDIDTDRKFSNGENLSAQHFKDSWEYSLRTEARSANNSLLDVLYKIEGYKEGAHSLSGLRVIDDKTLEITFKKSFRMALSHLGGTRMAAFVKEGDKFLGTGPYVINEISPRELNLYKNKHSQEETPYSKVNVKVMEPDQSQEALKAGVIDLYAFAEVGQVRSCQDELIHCVSGSENRHMGVALNGKEGRLFSNPKFRKAFQYLFFEGFSLEDIPEKDRVKSQIDPQIYLPLQAGHLAEDEVQSIIEEGKPYVDEFIEATKKTPLLLTHTEGTAWYRAFLKKRGIALSEKSKEVSGMELMNTYYKTHEPDILPLYLSVFSGDPDGIYHALGKNGAIGSPMIERKKVSDLLEEGRRILDFDQLDSHYKKVSRAVLEEVPFVHLGFLKEMVILRNDKVQTSTNYISRETGRFTDYSPAGRSWIR